MRWLTGIENAKSSDSKTNPNPFYADLTEKNSEWDVVEGVICKMLRDCFVYQYPNKLPLLATDISRWLGKYTTYHYTFASAIFHALTVVARFSRKTPIVLFRVIS